MRFEKVLVTGGSGRLGRFVVDALLPRCRVSVLDIAPPRQDVSFHEVDILDAGAVAAAVEGHDAIIHLAGFDDGMADREEEYLSTNVTGNWNVLQAAERGSVRRVVVASSVAAYGFRPSRVPDIDHLPVGEDHPLRSDDAYGLSKHLIEITCRNLAARGPLSIVCLRPTLIVRPDSEPAILAQLALPDPDSDPPPEAATGDGVRPNGALSATRGYVRSRDVAECFCRALDYDGRAFDVFNVSAADTIGRVHTLPRLEAILGRRLEVRKPEVYERDPCASVLDISRARERLGWEPRGDWRSIEAEHAAGTANLRPGG
jgi:nucleoside-diphosphate-sugar epimerase